MTNFERLREILSDLATNPDKNGTLKSRIALADEGIAIVNAVTPPAPPLPLSPAEQKVVEMLAGGEPEHKSESQAAEERVTVARATVDLPAPKAAVAKEVVRDLNKKK